MDRKKISIRYFTSQSERYLTVLSVLRERACWFFEGENQILSLPFVLTCAAALECSLNDTLIRAMDEQGNGPLLDGYLSMSLRGKLTNVCTIVTESEYRINTEHKSYLALAELVSLRNRLVHNRSTFEIHEGHVLKDDDDFRILAESLVGRIEDRSFGLTNVGRFHDALIDLHEKLLDVYGNEDFKGNDLAVTLPVQPDNDRLHLVISE
jgi:hypothetical protein